MTTIDHARGVLAGLACGDALGRPVDFQSPAEIKRQYGRVDEMIANGTHRQPAGTITDETDLAMCIARSLVEMSGFDGGAVAGARFGVGDLPDGWLSTLEEREELTTLATALQELEPR